MAKRAPENEVPYRPLDKVLVQSVLSASMNPAPQNNGGAVAVLEPPPAPPPPVQEPRPVVAAVAAAPAPSGHTSQVVHARSPQPALSVAPAASETRPQPVVREVPRAATVRSAPDVGLPERLDREKRFLLTRTEEREIQRLVDRMGGELGTSVGLSHIVRACKVLLFHAQDEILERARKSPGLVRPGNGNTPELHEFERSIAQILFQAVRDASPLR